jgi:hypothetical protein
MNIASKRQSGHTQVPKIVHPYFFNKWIDQKRIEIEINVIWSNLPQFFFPLNNKYIKENRNVMERHTKTSHNIN